MFNRVVVGITGASGAIYGKRLLELLLAANADIDLIITETGREVIRNELGNPRNPIPESSEAAMEYLPPGVQRVHENSTLGAPPASGSVPIAGMVIAPCSMGTIGKIAHGLGDDLLCRSAMVTLKEKRTLILIPREAPYSLIHLENMYKLTLAGATIIPASPSFYMHPRTIEDLVDSVISRVLDHLGFGYEMDVRWKGE